MVDLIFPRRMVCDAVLLVDLSFLFGRDIAHSLRIARRADIVGRIPECIARSPGRIGKKGGIVRRGTLRSAGRFLLPSGSVCKAVACLLTATGQQAEYQAADH